MNEYRRCPECGSPLIEDNNPVFKSWWCIVCGYMDKEWKRINRKEVIGIGRN